MVFVAYRVNVLWFGTQSELVTFVFPTLTVWDTHTVDTWDGGVVAYIVNRVCGLGHAHSKLMYLMMDFIC